MKIIVLNGSPKGTLSVTMQYLLYIKKKFPQHKLKILHVAQQIKKLEENHEKFQEIIKEIKSADGIVWGFPLYYMLVPSQYKRFIELIWERNAENTFKGKYTALVATSINFFDHMAINYMNAICDDLQMKCIGFFSAEMFDLMIRKQREQLILFAENFFYSIENNLPPLRQYPKLKYRDFDYTPSLIEDDKKKVNPEEKRILLITDSIDTQTNLGKMIEKFQDCFSEEIEIINLYDIDIKGGCLGCCQCGYDNQCIYKEKDGFTEFWNAKLIPADILIFAGNVTDRYLSSRWKMFFDRSFFNGHIPTLIRKQFAYILSGPLAQISNLKQFIQAYTESQESNLVNIVTDEFGDSREIDVLILDLAKNLIRFAKVNYIKPQTFLSKGGFKILRDAVFGRMRFIFQADHRFYEEHGYYDFPQDDERAIKMNDIFIPLTKNEKSRKQFYSMIKSQMVKPLQGVVANPNK